MYFHEAWKEMLQGKIVKLSNSNRIFRIIKERIVVGEKIINESFDLQMSDQPVEDEKFNWFNLSNYINEEIYASDQWEIFSESTN